MKLTVPKLVSKIYEQGFKCQTSINALKSYITGFMHFCFYNQQGPGTEQELRPIPTPRKKSDAGEGSAANYWSG